MEDKTEAGNLRVARFCFFPLSLVNDEGLTATLT
jgi:hypothetical protein